MRESITDHRRAALQAYFDARPRQLTAICKKARVSPEAVRGFLKGESASLEMATYDKLAQSEGVPVSVLLGERQNPPPEVVGMTEPQWIDLGRVVIEGRVQAGLFAEANELLPEERGFTYVPPDSPYARLPLKGFRLFGDSMNEFYPHGSILIVAPTIFLGEGWMPRDGQHVLVQRLNEWDESELTVKEIRYGPGDPPTSLDLVPRSTNPAFSRSWPFPIRRDEEAGDREKMRIVGLVVHFVGSAPGV